jgi:hypothetical protein
MTTETPSEALQRIQSGYSQNDELVLMAFTQAGYTNVVPRETVLTYRAWKAKGRQVMKGSKSLRVAVYVPIKVEKTNQVKRDDKGGVAMRPRQVALFHISQTEPVEGKR